MRTNERQGYLIDAEHQTVTEVTIGGLEHMQQLIGGFIEVAYHWQDTGDTLYVDEDGLSKRPKYWFDFLRRRDQPLAGNGLVVGREVEDKRYENGFTNRPPKITLELLTAMVRFRQATGGMF